MSKRALLGLAVALAGCGTSSPNPVTAQSAAVREKAQFVERTDAICARVFAEFKPLLAKAGNVNRAVRTKHLTPQRAFVVIHPIEERAYSIGRRSLADLSALRVPADGAQSIREWLAAEAKSTGDGERVLRALTTGRPAVISAAALEKSADIHRDRRLAAKVGLKLCH